MRKNLKQKQIDQPCRVCTVKVKTLIGTERYPGKQNEDICEDPNEAGNRELLNSAESSFPIDVAFPTLFEEVDSILSEEPVIASLELSRHC